MAKIQIKSEKLTFGGFFSIMEQFENIQICVFSKDFAI